MMKKILSMLLLPLLLLSACSVSQTGGTAPDTETETTPVITTIGTENPTTVSTAETETPKSITTKDILEAIIAPTADYPSANWTADDFDINNWDQFFRDDMAYSIERFSDYIYGVLELSGGGYLLALLETDRGWWEDPDTIEFRPCLFSFYREGSDIYYYERSTDWICLSEGVSIFFEEDWNDPENDVEYPSYFMRWDGYKGSDYLIYVTAGRRDTDHYEDSDMYGVIPYDTLSTEPLRIQDEHLDHNFPCWFFDIPADRVDESYALYFGDWVLTGEDLLSGTWEE